MWFKFKCSYCQNVIDAEEDWIGKEINCPKCGMKIKVSHYLSESSLNDTAVPERKDTVNGLSHYSPESSLNVSKQINPLIDTGEDRFVLGGLQVLKALTLFIVIILLSGICFTIGNSFHFPWLEVGLMFLAIILCLYILIILCWFRGMYRHNALLREIYKSISSSQKG